MDSQFTARVDHTRRHLAQLYAPGADNHTVKLCEKELLAFKHDLQPDAAVAASRILLAPILQDRPIQDYDLLFALQLVSERILQKPPWLAHSEQVRVEVRRLAVELVTHTDPKKYGNMVQEKSAGLVVALAIREWPQHWPNFIDELLSGALPPLMVCVILRLLSEEIHEFGGSIASARKHELNNTTNAAIPKLLPYITSSMDSFLNAQDAGGMRAAIAVIEAFMSWVPTTHLFDAHIPSACIKMLRYSEYAVGALSALHAMLKRKESKVTETGGVHLGYRKHIFPAVIEYTINSPLKSLLSLSYAPPMGIIPDAVDAFRQCSFNMPVQNLCDINSEMHEYSVKFVTMLAKLGSVYFIPSYVLSKDELTPEEQRVASAYVEIMLCTIASPSILIRNAGLSFFSVLFGSLHRALHKHMRESQQQQNGSNNLPRSPAQVSNIVEAFKKPFIRELFQGLVKRFVNTASLALVRWPKDPLLNTYAEEDFSGETEALNEAWDSFKSRAAQNISLATKLEPNSIMNVVLRRLSELLSKANAVSWPQNVPAENGTVVFATGKMPFAAGFITLEDSEDTWKFGNFDASHSKVVVAALDGAVLSCEAVLAMLTSLNFFRLNPSAEQPVRDLFKTFLSLSQPTLQQAKVSSLRMFIPLYKTNKEALQLCLTCLVGIIESSKGSTLCYRACTSLAALCRRLQKSRSLVLVEFLSPLRDFALKVQGDEGYFPTERSLVLDSAIAVTLLVKDLGEQTSVVESLLQPLISSLVQFGLGGNVGDPQALFNYLDSAPKKSSALAVLSSMESAMCQIVKANRSVNGPSAVQTALSKLIAPKVLELSVPLTRSVHAMYDPKVFPLTDQKRSSVLEPTSREVAWLLNINDESKTALWVNPVSQQGNETESDPEEAAKTSLERADDMLAKLGIRVPNAEHSELRESVKKMRVHAYEMLKCCILSGVTLSEGHLTGVLSAICCNLESIEPIHMHYLILTVVRPLLSHQVTQANDAYLSVVARSQVPVLIRQVQKMIEMSNAGVDTADSSLFALGVAREHGRKILAKTAADMLAGMFPRDMKKGEERVPGVFLHQTLHQCLHSLWDVLCSPVPSITDYGSARTAMSLVSRAVEQAPLNMKQMYASKLRLCLETAFRSDGMGSDSAHETALGAVLAFFRKWPEDSSATVMELIRGAPAEFVSDIAVKLKDLIASFTNNAHRKAARSKVRSIVRALAKKAGTSHRKVVTVEVLPTRAVLNVRRRMRRREDDVMLPDSTLDSLFGSGEPL